MHATSPLVVLNHIPTFVWIILAVISAIGVRLSRPAAMSATRVMVVPAIWLVIGLVSIDRSFGLLSLPALAWATGLAVSVGTLRALGWPGRVGYDTASRRFLVPGSWVPMALMLTIFVARSAMAMNLARHPELAHDLAFGAGFSAVFGLLSGAFLGRSVNILSRRPRTGAALA